VNNQERKKDVENAINDALKHEENLQHDKNENPKTFAENL
jgi:hypothetical protein